MQANIYQQAHYLSSPKQASQKTKLASTADIGDAGAKQAAAMGLLRIAGNYFECPCTHDLWRVNGDKISRLAKDEVDFQESVVAADTDDPKTFLANLMSELEF